MGRITDKLKWLITTKELKLIFVIRELLLLDYLVKKHIDFNDIKPREELYLINLLNSLKKGEEYKLLMKKYNKDTKTIFSSIITFQETMDKGLLVLTSITLEKLIERIEDEYNAKTNKDISKNKIVIDYLNKSKDDLNELGLYS
ncbi:hypothetical protein N9N76_02210 [Flavobacteriaceae bacterium]|nr:hypothetical protein [Flavobacteriaceae bacterium]